MMITYFSALPKDIASNALNLVREAGDIIKVSSNVNYISLMFAYIVVIMKALQERLSDLNVM